MIDSFATKAGLKNGPRNVEHEGKVRGGSLDSFACKADLKTEPASNQFYTNGNKNIDSFASKADLDKTPMKGWQSHNTPLSERSIKQSK